MGGIVASVTFLFLLIAVRKLRWFRVAELSPKWVTSGFIIRLFAGFALMAVYTWYYTERSDSDTWKYFDDAMQIRSWWKNDPLRVLQFLTGIGCDAGEMQVWSDRLSGWNSPYTYGLPYDYRTIVRLNLILSIFTFGQYPAHVVWMAFMGFTGSVAAYRAFKPWWTWSPKVLAIILGLLPTLIFWSSGAVKESPAWLLTGLFFLSLSRWIQHKSNAQLFASFTLLILLYFFKPYLTLAFVPAFISLLCWSALRRKWLIRCFVVVHVVGVALATGPVKINPAGDLMYILNKKRTDFIQVARQTAAGSLVQTPESKQLSDLLIHFPSALFLTCFRPWLHEAKNPVMIAAALENTMLLIAMCIALIGFRTPRRNSLPIWMVGISFVILNAIFIGFSVPILGAVVRYRFAALAVLCIIVGLCSDPQLIKVRLSRVFLKSRSV